MSPSITPLNIPYNRSSITPTQISPSTSNIAIDKFTIDYASTGPVGVGSQSLMMTAPSPNTTNIDESKGREKKSKPSGNDEQSMCAELVC